MFDRKINFIFLHTKDIEAAILAARLDDGGGITGGNGSGHSRVSDPTAIQGIKAATPIKSINIPYGAAVCGVRQTKKIKHPEKWVQIFHETEEHYKDRRQGEFFRRRYRNNESQEDIRKAMQISKGVYIAMKRDIIYFAELLAVGYGMLTPIKHEYE